MESSIKAALQKVQILGLGMLLVFGISACNAQKQSTGTASTTAQKESALRDLRDSGVISEQEYETRLAQLHGGEHGDARVKVAGVTAQRGTGNSWKLKRIDFTTEIGYDAMPNYGIPAWPKKQVVGASILAPADWDTKIGASNAPPDCNYTVGRIVVVSSSPDKKSAFVMLPGSVTIWSNNTMLLQTIQRGNQTWGQSEKCEIAQPQPLAQRAVDLLRKIDAGAQPAGALQPIPGLTDKLPGMLQQANASLAQQTRSMGRPSTLQAEAGRLRFTKDDSDGPVDGFLYVMQTIRTDFTPSGYVQSVDTPLYFITGAPQGKLDSDEVLFQNIAGSLHLDPEYQAACLQVSANIMHIHEVTNQRLNQISREMAADNARTAANISSIQAGVSQYRNQVMNHVAANRSAALEHSSQQFSMYMGDQAEYHDPSTGRNVQLPSGAGHVWASTTGNTNEYILTDSTSYDPNGKAGSGSWTQMQMVH